MPVGIVILASRGLGLDLSAPLAERGWRLIVDARGVAELERAAASQRLGDATAVPGDVGDDWHRKSLVDAAGPLIDLVVKNASVLARAAALARRSPQAELDASTA